VIERELMRCWGRTRLNYTVQELVEHCYFKNIALDGKSNLVGPFEATQNLFTAGTSCRCLLASLRRKVRVLVR
jgi:hypothetical protein